MLNVNELNVELAKIKGDIKLIERGIDTIRTNHLKHIEDDLKGMKRVLWAVGFLLLTQMVIIIRELLLRVGI